MQHVDLRAQARSSAWCRGCVEGMGTVLHGVGAALRWVMQV